MAARQPQRLGVSRSVACFLACLLTLAVADASCQTDFDCSYNGHCSSSLHSCVCYPQWKGPHCEALALLPSPRNAGYQPVMNASAPHGFRNASTWGGMVLRHDDGVYHMYAAQMSNNCGIWAWGQNSEVWHATSINPYGPYNMDGPAITPPEAHEPIVARAPTGEYVMWYTTGLKGPGGPAPVKGGKPCDCRTPDGIASCEYQQLNTSQMPTWMSYAKDPSGPWSQGRLIKAASGNPPDMTGDTNFAGLINPDGSVLAVGRHQVYHCRHWNDTDSCNVTQAQGMQGEDPFIWFDPRNKVRVLHMLRHFGRNNYNWTGNNGGHQFSLDDGLTWHNFDMTVAYPGKAEYDDGTTDKFMMRERPHLVFADDGFTPLALTNGVALFPFTGTGPGDKNDYSFTLLQKINQDASVVV